MTQLPEDLITVAEAARRKDERPQKFHKAVRDGVLVTYEKPGYPGRMVSEAEVEAWLSGIGSRKPGRAKGQRIFKPKVVMEGDFIVRTSVREVARFVDVVTQTYEEYFSTRGIVNCEPDKWTSLIKNATAKELMEQDEMFILDRWALIKLLEESFKVTGESDIAATLQQLAEQHKEASVELKEKRAAEYKASFEKIKNAWMIENGFIDDPDRDWEEEE